MKEIVALGPEDSMSTSMPMTWWAPASHLLWLLNIIPPHMLPLQRLELADANSDHKHSSVTSPTENIQLSGLPQPHGQCPHLPRAGQCNLGPEGGTGLTSWLNMISLNILCSRQFVLSHTPANPAEQSSPLKGKAGCHSRAPWALLHIHRCRWLVHHLGNSFPLCQPSSG